MKILTILGARPQFIKAAMVSKAIADFNTKQGSDFLIEEIIHTGQHYDQNMSEVFFDQMDIAKPVVRFDLGGGSHGAMTGQMLEAIEKEIIDRKPDWVLVYGDTNSTLAGALAAAKLHVPVAHVEAGLRSFNKRMPEEINRIMTDHASSLLLCPTSLAVDNLKAEGILDGVHQVGDVMYDAALFFCGLAEKRSTVLSDLKIDEKSFFLATVHRQENTDDFERLKNIVTAFEEIACQECPLVLPLHPRTKNALKQYGLNFTNPNVLLVPPLSFLDMVMLEKNAKVILTDSGGVQKEAYFHNVPCITLRDETEWVELVDGGFNVLAGANINRIKKCCSDKFEWKAFSSNMYGNGRCAQDVVSTMVAHTERLSTT